MTPRGLRCSLAVLRTSEPRSNPCWKTVERICSSQSLVLLLLSCTALAATAQSASAAEPHGATVHVDATPGHAINSFDPDSALGSSIDVLSHDGIDKVYTPHIIQESLSAGWGPITYRNNSELRMAAWHWTENGTWSDPAHKSGYFTGSTELKEPTALHSVLCAAAPRLLDQRRPPAARPESQLLEEQSLSHQQVHG